MSKLVLVCSIALLAVSAAWGQGKINSEWNCDAKAADEHAIPVGDQPGHAYWIGQGRCTAGKGIVEGVQEQEGTWTQFNDLVGASNPNHGMFLVTMQNGDKVYYNYHGTAMMRDGKLQTGTNQWTIVGGTGKFAGAKGEGSCKGKGNADGSGTWDCTGTYSVGK
jgi:hypothetical protein